MNAREADQRGATLDHRLDDINCSEGDAEDEGETATADYQDYYCGRAGSSSV